MLKIPLGQPVEVEGEIISLKTRELVDPEEPTLRLLLPNGEVADIALTKASKGVYLLKYDPPTWGIYGGLSRGEGEWKYAWESKRLFEVLKPGIPRD